MSKALLPANSPGSLSELGPSATPSPHGFSPEQIDQIMQGIYQRGDRIIGRCLQLHAALALVLATFYSTWLITIVVSAAAVGMFMISRALLPRSAVTRSISSVSLQTFVALHIYQLHGLPEMHFFFFTAFALMIVYQDWKCMWLGTILIIGQHILFAVLHNSGVNLYFFEDPYVGFRKLFFHFGIAIVHVGICGYWAHLKRCQTIEDAWRRLLLKEKTDLAEKELAHSQAQGLELTRMNTMLESEVAERKRIGAQLQESLTEKETLLKEIHHRVKNNMQVISSLLQLQSNSIENPEVLTIFRESQHRIRSIAVIHEKLYQTQSLSRMDFAEYVQSLTAILIRTYGPQNGSVKLEVRAEPVWMDVNTAIPAGLILNELVSNCLKHAFPDGREGRVQVELGARPRGMAELVVRDDGVGLPEGFAMGHGSSLGLCLAGMLAEQLRGSLHARNGTGSEFTAVFSTTRRPVEEPAHL